MKTNTGLTCAALLAALLLCGPIVFGDSDGGHAGLERRVSQTVVEEKIGIGVPGADDLSDECNDADEATDDFAVTRAVTDLSSLPAAVLVLEGSGFCESPGIFAGAAGGALQELFVTASGETFAVAQWTAPEPGTAAVRIECPRATRFIDVTVGAVGPPGPAGPPGADGLVPEQSCPPGEALTGFAAGGTAVCTSALQLRFVDSLSRCPCFNMADAYDEALEWIAFFADHPPGVDLNDLGKLSCEDEAPLVSVEFRVCAGLPPDEFVNCMIWVTTNGLRPEAEFAISTGDGFPTEIECLYQPFNENDPVMQRALWDDDQVEACQSHILELGGALDCMD